MRSILNCLLLASVLIFSLARSAVVVSPEAQRSVISYSGSTYGAASWATPEFLYDPISSEESCSASDSSSEYETFQVTFETAGMREIVANGQSWTNIEGVDVYVYSGSSVDPHQPCTNLIAGPLRYQLPNSEIVEVTHDAVYFAPGTYTFVLSVNGLFAINITTPMANNSFTSETDRWLLPSYDIYGVCSQSNYYRSPVDFWTWQQSTSGEFDLTSFVDNTTFSVFSDFSAGFVLYSGALNITDIGNNSCGVPIIASAFTTKSSGAVLFRAKLTAGSIYTVAISVAHGGGGSQWSFDIVPTRVRFFNTNGFNQPGTESGSGSCSGTSYQNTGWQAIAYQSVPTTGIFLVSAFSASSPFADVSSMYAFLYKGITWTGDITSPPPTCPAGDSLVSSGHYLFSESYMSSMTSWLQGSSDGKYTLVLATYDSASPAQAFLLYELTGSLLGTAPPGTSGSSMGSTGSGTTTANSASTFSTLGSHHSDSLKLSGVASLVIALFLIFLSC